MTRTRILAGLVAALAVAGVGTATVALADGPGVPTAAPVSAPAVSAVGPDDARRTAVAHLGGGTAGKVEHEVEHGRAVWEVDVRRGATVTEVHVDTATGTVSRVEGRSDRTGD